MVFEEISTSGQRMTVRAADLFCGAGGTSTRWLNSSQSTSRADSICTTSTSLSSARACFASAGASRTRAATAWRGSASPPVG